MYARVTSLHFEQAKFDQAIKLFRESIVPAAKEQTGYRGLFLLTNRNTSKALALALWASEKEAHDNEHSGYYQEQTDKLMDYVVSSPIREDYKLTVRA
ncbi:MAG: hypothetical protein GY863_08730 [bacterium]|nr:hypothetical protein [bacterium]